MRFFLEVRERAVLMVFDTKDPYESQWVAIVSVSGKIGCTPESLRRWIRQQKCAAGRPFGLSQTGCPAT
ncbi:hypothetical protein [Laribacter hongkongensis]|uniref:hypothetical protein n=1 Tax=Laribacter hongkongensis TaxID=168471 RepID=UPI00040F9596|nr:hypothetical protein [Laribacter hongkongensis]